MFLGNGRRPWPFARGWKFSAGFSSTADDGRLDRLRAGNLEQHQLVRIDALAPRSVDSSQQQIEPMLQLLDLPLRRGQLLLLLENDLPEKLQIIRKSCGVRAHALGNTAALERFRENRSRWIEIHVTQRAAVGSACVAARCQGRCPAAEASIRWPRASRFSPGLAFGVWKVPASSRFAQIAMPSPSQYKSFIRSRRRLRNTNSPPAKGSCPR